MDFRKKEQLLKKYWKGETTVEEENWLKAHAPAFRKEAAYLKQLQAFSEVALEQEFDMDFIEAQESGKTKPLVIRRILSIAATVLVLIALSVASYNIMNTVSGELAEEKNISLTAAETEEAFEVAKQSLLLMSAKLNKGVKHTVELERFSEIRDRLETGAK